MGGGVIQHKTVRGRTILMAGVHIAEAGDAGQTCSSTSIAHSCGLGIYSTQLLYCAQKSQAIHTGSEWPHSRCCSIHCPSVDCL